MRYLEAVALYAVLDSASPEVLLSPVHVAWGLGASPTCGVVRLAGEWPPR
jgi:hypothetical protein